MDSKKIWYYFGAGTGITIRIAIYLIGIYGIVTQLWNREIPYLPIILLFSFHAWAKILVIYDAVVFLANSPRSRVDQSEVERMVNAINYRNMYFGGPN